MKDEFTPYTPNPEKIIELFEKLEKGEILGKRSKGFLVAGKFYNFNLKLANFSPAIFQR